MYIVITNVSDDKRQYMVMILNSEFQIQSKGVVDYQRLCSLSTQCIPLNYSIQNGVIKDDCGQFSRLKNNGITLIVLCALTVRGRSMVKHYKVLNAKTGMIQVVDRESLLRQQSLQKDIPLLQNAIIRGGTISAFPGKEFHRVEIRPTGKTPSKKSETHDKDPNKAVSPDFMNGNNFTKDQVLMLVKAKKRGVPVEMFASDKIPTDVLEFYCDTMVDKNIAEDCKPMFDNPNLSKNQVEELYQCVMMGMSIEELANGDKTPSEIEIERLNKGMDTWGNFKYKTPLDTELVEKCVRMAENTLK